MKKFSFFFLFFIFANPVFAELSDQKKREILEGLSKPLEKPQTFYHWHSNITFLQSLVESGEMTPEIYEHLMSLRHDQAAAGLLVSENIADGFAFSSRFIEIDGQSIVIESDGILVEVVLDKGYPMLDISDPKVRMKLEKQGISMNKAARLNPKVAIKAQRRKLTTWILKEQEGINFKAFTGEGKNLKELGEAYYRLVTSNANGRIKATIKGQPTYFFKNAIKKYVLEQAKKDNSILETSLTSILEEEYGREYVSKAVSRHMASRPPIQTFDEGLNILQGISPYLSTDEIQTRVHQTKRFPVPSVSGLIDFLESAGKHLSKADIKKAVEEIPIRSIEDGIKFLGSVDSRFLSAANKSKIVDATLPFVESEEQLARFKPHLSNSVYEKKLSKFKNQQKKLARQQTGTKSTSKNNPRLKCLKDKLSKLL